MNLGEATFPEARARLRAGAWSGPTSGMAPEPRKRSRSVLVRKSSCEATA